MENQETEQATNQPQTEAILGLAASGAQATAAAPEQEPETSYADIVLFCHPRNVSNLVQALEREIKHAAGELPAFVLWSGVSGVLHQGVIALEWKGKVTPAFLRQLSIDYEIFDYVVYET